MLESKEQFIQNINSIYPMPMLTDKEIACILGVHKETVYRMRKRGDGPKYLKMGRKALCLKNDFFLWFFENYHKNNLDSNNMQSS